MRRDLPASLPPPLVAVGLSEPVIIQGRTLVVEVTLSDPNASLTGNFEGRPLLFWPSQEDTFWTIIAIHALAEPNIYPIVLTATLDDLRAQGYDAFFIGTGAGLPNFMRIPGENLIGVYSANEYLTRVNLMRAFDFPQYDTPVFLSKKAIVLGGGNVAMDSVRTVKRLGAEKATIVYRRSEKEMPARVEEVHHARDEGIVFEMLTNPIRILGDDDGWVKGMECLRMELGEPDDSGRRRPVPIEGSNFVIDADVVVVAVGASANPLLSGATPDLKLNRWGYIEVDDNLQTSKPGVFAGGDIVRGSATVILAMGDGRTAAKSIDTYLTMLGDF